MPMSNKEVADWEKLLKASFVPLVKLNPDTSVEGYWGSGTLFEFRNQRFLCSARHVFRDARIAMQVRWSPEHFETLITRQLSPDFFKLQGGGFLDFAVCPVSDIKEIPLMQELNQNCTGEIEYERRRILFSERSLVEPNARARYGFAGITMPERLRHKDERIDIASGTVRLITDLTHSSYADGFHLFKLPVNHPGDEFFRGCSGAPIINPKGYIVAFVTGSTEDGLIKGFPAVSAKGILKGCVITYSKKTSGS